MGAAIGIVMLTAAGPAGANEAQSLGAGGQAASAASVAHSDPMVFGLGLAGLLWLLAGLLALVAGIALATRRVHSPITGSRSTAGIATTTSNENAGGADK